MCPEHFFGRNIFSSSVQDYIGQGDGTTDLEITVNTGRQQMHKGLLIKNIFALIVKVSDVGIIHYLLSISTELCVKYINRIGEIDSCSMFGSFTSS